MKREKRFRVSPPQTSELHASADLQKEISQLLVTRLGHQETGHLLLLPDQDLERIDLGVVGVEGFNLQPVSLGNLDLWGRDTLERAHPSIVIGIDDDDPFSVPRDQRAGTHKNQIGIAQEKGCNRKAKLLRDETGKLRRSLRTDIGESEEFMLHHHLAMLARRFRDKGTERVSPDEHQG